MNTRLQTIPSQLVIGFIDDSFVRILEIDGGRLVMEHDRPMDGPLDIMLIVFNYKEYSYDRFQFDHCDIVDSRKDDFSYIFTIDLSAGQAEDGSTFGRRVEEIASMLDFARNRTLEDPEDMLRRMDSFANYLPVYPRKLETRFHETFRRQMDEWFDLRLVPGENDAFAAIAGDRDMALAVNRPALVKRFCQAPSLSEAVNDVFAKRRLQDHGLFSKSVSRLYIGNEFCSHLFPKRELLAELMEKAAAEGFDITISTSFVTEDLLELHTGLLDWLHNWSVQKERPVEVVFNDWGLLHYIKQNQLRLIPVMGRLLNKRKKDPRQQWQFGRERFAGRLTENSLNQPHFRSFLKNYGIRRYEFEAHPSANLVPEGNHSLHFPYFQMNTSHYCPLYAECRYYNRAAQRKVVNCPHYCEEFVFLYPTHLNVIGWGNTLFGFNRRSLQQPMHLQDAVSEHIDRLVFSP